MWFRRSHADDIVRAIHQTQAVIEFSLDGPIEIANQTLLNSLSDTLKVLNRRG